MIKQNSKKITTAIVIAFLLLCSTFLTGCDFAILFRKTLEAPIINLNGDDKTIVWSSVANANTYDIYVNNNHVANINDQTINASNRLNTFSFADYINDSVAIYQMYVIAKAEEYNDSAKSNQVTYITDSETNQVNGVTVNNTTRPVTGVRIEGSALIWNEVNNVDEYYIMINDNENGVQVVSSEQNAINFSEYIIEDQILAFRVGTKNRAGDVCFSDTVYYNDALFGETYASDAQIFANLFSNIYVFRGKVYDYYITDQYEFNALVYSMFINRIESQEVVISQNYYSSLVSMYGENYYLLGNNYNIPGAIGIAANAFTETCDYDITFSEDKIMPARHFYLGFEFKYITPNNEPTLSFEPQLTQSVLDKGYYDKTNYEPRLKSYNNFASDKHFLETTVETSEQLFHAVEGKVTPVFTSENSSAYIIYNKAKDILREIISDEMSTYEKVLSIFDWICLNSVYDKEIISYFDENVSFTNYTSFSIEGVINDHVAVCDGYSKTFSLLCNMEGIDCFKFSGGVDENRNQYIDRNEGLHAWNKVKVSGSWYVVDITWSVISTGANDFDLAGTEQYNKNEFLNHMYFLVADEDIPTHIATDVTLNQKCAAQNRYYYYLNQTYDGVNNLVINSDKDLADLVAFMLENEIYSMDVVFDKETYGSYSSVSGYINFPAITNAIKYAKTTNGIDAANIMYPSMLFQNNIYYSNKIGLVYNISLVNLDKLEPQAA